MEFSPHNPVIKRCVEGINLEEQGNTEAAGRIFMRALEEATQDLEKFFAAYFIARQQQHVPERLNWFEMALALARKVNDDTVKGAYAPLYAYIAACYRELHDRENAEKYSGLAESAKNQLPDEGPFYHGTKASLQPGDLLTAGGRSNYQPDIVMNHIYFTATLSGAGLAAVLAKGDGQDRVYLVEPTGSFENDPNVTDKKFPGNPTRSYRSLQPLKVLAEVGDWSKMTAEEHEEWRKKLAGNTGKIIN
ncbi:MAG: NAD(+)--rifampin ADP-ribosyltransferase [Mucilaginibacter polytrichastri]|nr:NAD(+)--rifampin ADP-ribosyltransferase [Mucilaginibacter polytrichastri]